MIHSATVALPPAEVLARAKAFFSERVPQAAAFPEREGPGFVVLRGQGKTHTEVCDELNRLGYRTRTGRPWQHPQQIVKLLRFFGGEG